MGAVMSNGYIEARHFGLIANAVTTRITEGNLSVIDIDIILADIKAEALKVTNTDLIAVARDIVREDYEATGHTVKGLHKIQGIKDIRTRCGVGLKEAKESWEAAVPVVIREHAEDVLRDLVTENDRVRFASQQSVSAVEFRAALHDVREASETAPF